jgi:small subunit ribosomal protein S20
VATHKDAIKRLKQSEKARAANRAWRSQMRNQVKRVRDAVASGDHAAAMAELRTATSVIQRVCGKGVIHRNQAARRVQRLNAAVRALAPKPR